MWKTNFQEQVEAVASSFASVENLAKTGSAPGGEVEELRHAVSHAEAEAARWKESAVLAKELQGAFSFVHVSGTIFRLHRSLRQASNRPTSVVCVAVSFCVTVARPPSPLC